VDALRRRRLESHETTRNAKPNSGHYFVAALHVKEKLIGLITQNVHGLHGDSGLPGDKIVELHGSHRKVVCLDCGKDFEPERILKSLAGEFSSPKCGCGGILKPATVSFGQSMPAQAMRQAEEWTGQAEIFMVMGSSLQVQPAAAFPVLAKRRGALLAIVNREPGPLDGIADYLYHGAIGEFCGRFNVLIADG
jgi:NAD-dependent deacetylase